MKNLLKALPLVVILGIFGSCENDETVQTPKVLSDEQTLAVVESETIADELDNIVDDFFGSIDAEMGSKTELADKSQDGREGLLSCAIKTVVVNGTEKSVTLDFGDGCETPTGDILKGIIKMDFQLDLTMRKLTIVKSFENFYFNDVQVEGTRTVVKTRANEDGFPESAVTFQTKMTWEDGAFAERSGSRTRTFIEGFETRPYGDNVFSIEGSSVTTLSDGSVISAEITIPLIRKMACHFIVSGEKVMIRAGVIHVLNFGDGECDNLATLTVDGESREIELRKRRHQ